MHDYSTATAGHFYAVGVGPGAPDLLTLRAARLIGTADVILAPKSAASDDCLALATVQPHLRPERQEIVEHVYRMRRDPAGTAACWRVAAELVAERCRAGKSVVQITLGDPLVYSTSTYLMAQLVNGLLSPDQIHVVSGISAFQAAAALFAAPLTVQEDRLTLMPATDLDAVAAALDRCETLVLYKAGKKIRALADLLESRGLLGVARLVCYAEQNGRQFVSTDLRAAQDGLHGYMATVIIHLGRKEWDRGATPGSPADG